jgi:hypothetical protein
VKDQLLAACQGIQLSKRIQNSAAPRDRQQNRHHERAINDLKCGCMSVVQVTACVVAAKDSYILHVLLPVKHHCDE